MKSSVIPNSLSLCIYALYFFGLGLVMFLDLGSPSAITVAIGCVVVIELYFASKTIKTLTKQLDDVNQQNNESADEK